MTLAKRLFCALLCLTLLLTLSLPALAAEQAEETEAPSNILTIFSLRGFLKFAERCRLDSYSQGLTVYLKADLDLSGTKFDGIPIFCGTFLGFDHTISGLELTADGSYQGLFRYLTETAAVHDLTVTGTVQPSGSQEAVGGIAGSNAGLIHNCSFEGALSGGGYTGGLAGKNTLTGIIENSQVRGSVNGTHFVGGIAGENKGVIRGSTNYALINTTVQQNTVSMTDVTLDNLMNSESTATVTDIGGIAGSSSGVIRSCINRGDVGYPHMGYNIGGIAGTQSGYLTGCKNYGQIQGRKEVGGIVGQMEPAALIQYDADALQILQGQLEGMSGIVNQTTSNLQSSGEAITGHVNSLQIHVYDALDSVALLVPDPSDPKLPDQDAIAAAESGLSSSLAGMTNTLQGMSAATYSAVGLLSNNLHALQRQINAMSATLGNVSETMGGSVQDVSDQDTQDNFTGKVETCQNLGPVLADLNGGGIAGAMAVENDMDVREDFDILGENSLNFESQLRAVVLDCENQADITVGKAAAGGITGWQSVGLVKDCCNTGMVDCSGGEYAGGISGQSTGFIRSSSANCVLSGSKHVGGIAGSAAVVTDCRSLVRLDHGTEKLGATLGTIEENNTELEVPISGNYYFPLGQDIGGIDGISYDGLSQSLSAEDFFSLADLPEIFSRALVTFRYADGTHRQIRIATGTALDPDTIPQLPELEGHVGHWEGLNTADTSQIYFDMTFDAVYTKLRAVIQSETLTSAGLPLLLLQGQFHTDSAVIIEAGEESPSLSEKETLLGTWDLTLPQSDSVTGARLWLPEDCKVSHLTVKVRSGGQWQEVPHSPDGSYTSFPLTEETDAIALIQRESFPWYLPAAGAGAAVLLLLLIFLLKKRKKKA